MKTVTSRDGTTIAFEQLGQGPALILVGGAISDRTGAMGLATVLADHFTVCAYDRRGRGDSDDTAPYAVEREIEDLEALSAEAGGSAFVFGHSSGAVLSLRAAASGLPIPKLAVYEPPFIVDDTRPPLPEDYAEHIQGLIVAGRKGDALAYFMTTLVEMPEAVVSQWRDEPSWAASENVAHTLAYDIAVAGDTMSSKPLSEEPWNRITVPTLVMAGGASAEWQHNGVRALADVLPNARLRTLEGQGHGAADDILAPLLVEFFSD